MNSNGMGSFRLTLRHSSQLNCDSVYRNEKIFIRYFIKVRRKKVGNNFEFVFTLKVQNLNDLFSTNDAIVFDHIAHGYAFEKTKVGM